MAVSSSAKAARKSARSGPRAIELLDESVSLIRTAPLSLLSIYYLGAVPFCLGVIYCWFDLTEGAEAQAHLPAEALVLTGLYLWMKTGQALFARKILALLESSDEEPWDLQRYANTALLQAIFAGTFLVVYPVALVITLPFGWVNAFYHNISMSATSSKSTLRSSFNEAADLAKLWPKQNHALIGIQLIAALFLFLNLAVFFTMIPQLLNMLFGIETIFDENGFAWTNTSFFLDVTVFCFLILNPVNKAVYVLRNFYGRSRLNGADLKSAFRRSQLLPATTGLRVAVTILLLLLFSNDGRAQTSPTPGTPSGQLSAPTDPAAAKLDQAIQKTLQSDDFAWRMPRAAFRDDDGGNWFQRNIHSIYQFFRDLFHTPIQWLRDFFKWLLKTEHQHDASTPGWNGLGDFPWKWIFLLFALVAVAIFGFWLVGYFQRRAPVKAPSASLVAVRTVDLEAEEVRADDLPEDSWLALAQQMIERGELRLALRAFYLASLSVLANSQLVRLAASKSNRDYLLELTRRQRGDASLPGFFCENSRLFEASWYGTHAVTSAILEAMRDNQQRMKSHAAP